MSLPAEVPKEPVGLELARHLSEQLPYTSTHEALQLGILCALVSIADSKARGDARRAPLLVLSLSDVAEELGIEERVVKEQLIASGRLPHVRVTPRKTVVSRAALEEWIAKESQKSVDGQEEVES